MNDKSVIFNECMRKSCDGFSLEILFGLKPEFINKGLFISQFSYDCSLKVEGGEEDKSVSFTNLLRGLFSNGDKKIDDLVGDQTSKIVKSFFNYELELMDGGTYIQQGLFEYVDCYDSINDFYDNHRQDVLAMSPSGLCISYNEISFLNEYMSRNEISMDELLLAIKNYISAYVEVYENMFEVLEVCMVNTYTVTSSRSVMSK